MYDMIVQAIPFLTFAGAAAALMNRLVFAPRMQIERDKDAHLRLLLSEVVSLAEDVRYLRKSVDSLRREWLSQGIRMRALERRSHDNA